MGIRTKNSRYFIPTFVLCGLSVVGLFAFGQFALGRHLSATPKVENAPKSAENASSDSESSSSESVWIMRQDKSSSCEPKSGVPLEESAEDLKRAQIPILDSKKASDRKVLVQMCGAPPTQGNHTNSFLIPRSRLADALTLGYQEVPASHRFGSF